MKKIFTDNIARDLPISILRASIGLIMLPHGLQKLMGWFGGFGYQASINFFTETIHLPWIVAFLFVITESVGSVLLILGIGTRIISTIFAIIMAGAAYTHSGYGFFMNWFNNQQGEGIEFHLLMLIVSVLVALYGGGGVSLDSFFSNRLKKYQGI
jgi:putative oxidoreductase